MKTIYLMLLTALWCVGCQSTPSTMSVIEPRCEYLENPLGLDVTTPRLMWKLASLEDGASQKAYRVRVASSLAQLTAGNADVWDSKKVKSDEPMTLCTPALPLASHTRYYWSVEVWDNHGNVSVQNPIAEFETGKMAASDWKATWITDSFNCDYKPTPRFRTEFTAQKPIVSARAYICGLGYYELFLNGERVGRHQLDPGYTDFGKRNLYVTYDVTQQVQMGQNCVGVQLGNGWYNEQTPAVWNFHQAPWRNRPRMLCELRLTYEDGTTDVVASDSSWMTATGPILFDNLYVGTIYDARLEQPGWSSVGYDTKDWVKAQATQAPAPILEAQKMQPIIISDTLAAVSFQKINSRLYVYDMGKNFAGVSRLKVSGPRGTEVILRYGELLDAAGRVDQRNINMHMRNTDPNESIQRDTYILKGEGVEYFVPPFTYHGFQYVQVEASAPIELTLESVAGVVMHSDVEPTGNFECSNDMINKIFDICKRSYLSNLFGLPTDCPHREKNGWMADGYMVQEAGMINFDSRNIYAKWVTDMVDAQDSTGNVPGIVPTSWKWDSNWAGALWDAAIFITPHLLYQYTGDLNVLQTIYPVAKRYLTYLQTIEQEDGTINNGLGDWLFYKAQTPVDFLSSCFYYWDLQLMIEMAHLTGNASEATPYMNKASQLKETINRRFFDAKTMTYSNGTQLSYALPLYIGIAPDSCKAQLAENLHRVIRENDYSLDFGFIGSLVVPDVLSDYGYAEATYRMVTKNTLPSWGYWIDSCGATSLFETWDIMRNVGDASRNHPSMGAISAWMYKTLAGIRSVPDAPAFRQVEIRPAFVKELSWVDASYNSQRGTIRSGWKREGDLVTLTVTIPANVTAKVTLPCKAEQTLNSQGDNRNIEVLESAANAFSYRIGCGTYRFVCAPQ
ncbi:MAG: glycoside hydrolase family 78 protein [Alistipes sp.]|nr:glycoside hydrolase family 78 protein [Alistipes sp.]